MPVRFSGQLNSGENTISWPMCLYWWAVLLSGKFDWRSFLSDFLTGPSTTNKDHHWIPYTHTCTHTNPPPQKKTPLTLQAILNGEEEILAWLDYESVPLPEVSITTRHAVLFICARLSDIKSWKQLSFAKQDSARSKLGSFLAKHKKLQFCQPFRQWDLSAGRIACVSTLFPRW